MYMQQGFNTCLLVGLHKRVTQRIKILENSGLGVKTIGEECGMTEKGMHNEVIDKVYEREIEKLV